MDNSPYDMSDSLLKTIRDLGLQESYVIFPSMAIHPEDSRAYWDMLEEADVIKYRLCNVVNPDADYAEEYSNWILNNGDESYQFYIVDAAYGTIVAELVLDNYMGASAQLHFSINPNNSPELNAFLGNQVTDTILYNWKDTKGLGGFYLDTLYGLTPVDNRPACIFVLKSGMSKIGTLPNGSKYMGDVCDSMITYKTRNT